MLRMSLYGPRYKPIFLAVGYTATGIWMLKSTIECSGLHLWLLNSVPIKSCLHFPCEVATLSFPFVEVAALSILGVGKRQIDVK